MKSPTGSYSEGGVLVPDWETCASHRACGTSAAPGWGQAAPASSLYSSTICWLTSEKDASRMLEGWDSQKLL